MIVAAPVPAGPAPASLPTIVPHPAAPTTIEASGLSVDLVLQLALKTLHFGGELTGAALADRLCLRYPAIEPALDQLKAAHHLTIGGGSMLGGAAFRYRITDAGRARAGLFLAQPVLSAQRRCRSSSIATTCARSWRGAAPGDARAREAGVLDLVVSDRVDRSDRTRPSTPDRCRCSSTARRATAKTVMARAMRDLLDGDIAIPHATVEGQIVRLSRSGAPRDGAIS